MLKLKQTNAAFFKASQNLEVSYLAKARQNLGLVIKPGG